MIQILLFKKATSFLSIQLQHEMCWGGGIQAPLAVDIVKVDLLLARKILKCHFLKDIEKSFQEVTPMGPEPR